MITVTKITVMRAVDVVMTVMHHVMMVRRIMMMVVMRQVNINQVFRHVGYDALRLFRILGMIFFHWNVDDLTRKNQRRVGDVRVCGN